MEHGEIDQNCASPIQIDRMSVPEPHPDKIQIDCPHSEEQVREALLSYYANDCFFDPNSVNAMTICDISPNHSFRYVLETFWEERTLQDKAEPCNSNIRQNLQVQNNNNYVSETEKWTIPANSPEPFSTTSGTGQISCDLVDLPNAKVVPCSSCNARGYTLCATCNGTAYNRCTWCTGTGLLILPRSRAEFRMCPNCSGTGSNVCYWCHRMERSFYEPEQTNDHEQLPKHLLKSCPSKTIALTETRSEDPQPLKCPFDWNITPEVKRLIEEECKKQDQNSRIRKFRQKVTVIPVLKVIYKSKGKQGHFFLYGNTKPYMVYFPGGYVANSWLPCCHCSIV